MPAEVLFHGLAQPEEVAAGRRLTSSVIADVRSPAETDTLHHAGDGVLHLGCPLAKPIAVSFNKLNQAAQR
ncbi:hypothetical protein [Novosphingobium sp. 9U]|uniref:hypothetical protein n=1 Tax=Novosphingobium sp. 9U TaxID=2653158 RepID=UPI00135A4344|nr:hypothetical protein [Novosphingobium sp. 9U]